MQPDLKAALDAASRQVDAAVMEIVPDTLGPIADAMRYAVVGGKCLRGFLVLEGARVNGVEARLAIPAATAIECVHAYSLVHDDLPCMDDDDMRRGRPTVHKAWDEATAVLAGDGLQALAFDLVARGEDLPATTRLELSSSLAQAAGLFGMVGGQARDMAAETADRPLSLDEIVLLQRGKTGALIEWAARAGAILAGSDPKPLGRYGECLGLAFQIADDILDVEGDATAMGKAVGKDAARGKATFVSHLGLDGAKRRAAELVTEACECLSLYGEAAETLREAARFVIARRT